jgi:hypothetical protein
MNRNNIKNEVEKSLKRFLKDKLKITASLLVGFLISGRLSFGSSSADLALQITLPLEDLLNQIAIEKSEIQALIDANDARLKELNGKEFELLRVGNFYSKSLKGYSQILFPIIIENSGKMRDRTNTQFKQTFDAAKKYYAENGYILDVNGDVAGINPISGLTLEEAIGLSYDEQIEILLKKGQGILPKINTPDVMFIDIGVNIQLLTPEIPTVNINTEARTPEVNFPILSIPTIPNVTAPVTPTIPSIVSITVEAPTPISGVNVAIPIITEPQIPQERDITVGTPQTPGVFDPLTIIPPDPPEIPIINIPNTPDIEINVMSYGNDYEVYVDNPSGETSIITHVGITAGEFYVKRDDGSFVGPGDHWDNRWEYKYDNYDVINIGAQESAGDIILASRSGGGVYSTLTGLTTSGVYKQSTAYQRAFLRQLEKYPTYTNAKFVVARAMEDSSIETDEFVHMDMHGGTSAANVADRLLVATTISGKNIEVLGAWNDVITNLQDISNQFVYNVMVNSGSIYLEGGNLSLDNMYDHNEYGKNVFMNTGNIILQPYNDGGAIYGGQNAVFVVSSALYGNPHDIMYNGETGNIGVYTKDSVGYIVDSGQSSSYGNIYLNDYSNHIWSVPELNPTNGYPEVYDAIGEGVYGSLEDVIELFSYNGPYETFGPGIPVYSTVNRGNFDMYGSGSAGIYIKNAGGFGNRKYVKDTRGSVTIAYDVIGIDASANGGVPDYITYPQYGYPVVAPTHQYLKTYYPNGFPDDYTDITNGGDIDVQFVKEDGITPAPLRIYGDRSVGLYIGTSPPATYDVTEHDVETGIDVPLGTFTSSGAIGNVTGKLYVDLGDNLGTGNKTYTSDPSNTQGNPIINDPLGNTNLDTIDGSAGIISGSRVKLEAHGIRIFDGNKDSIGVGVINDAVLDLGQGYINIFGGEDNIGIMIDEGTVNSQGEMNISGGTGSIGVLQSSGNIGTVNMPITNIGDIGNTVNQSVGLFAVNTGTELTFTGKINVYGNNYGVFATDNSKIILNKTSLTGTRTNPDLYIRGTTVLGKPVGVGIMAARNTGGGTIEARNYYITAVDSNAGVASLGTGSLIDLQGSVVDYSGSGYAVYSDGFGIVDLRNNGEINLRNGTALEMDLLNPPTVLFDATSKITVFSNDAVVINLKNVMGGLQTSTLHADVVSYLGGVNIVDGVEFAITYDKYKIAAVDGGNFTVDTALNKSDTNPSSDSFFYFRRFLAQRMNMNILQNVNSTITNQYSVDYFKGQVTGLELSSSQLATSRADTSINIVASATITADRIDAGDGGIGVYINYGNVTNAGSIRVETGANTVNESGIGIYAVNGAHAQNSGTVEIAGKNGVGLYGTSYRLATNGDLVPMEFGAALTDQGETRLENSGTIKTTGEESIGIYGLNNSDDPSLPPLTPTHQMNIINAAAGIIDVAAGDSSVGIYGVGDVIISNTGTIKVGEEGVGIYSKDDSVITNLGTIVMGIDAIGVILEGTGTITSTGTFTPAGTWVTGERGKIAIVAKGKVDGVIDITPKTLYINIDASGLNHGIVLYVKDKGSIISNGNINVGNVGIGIYLNNGDVVNNGIIDLGSSANASGMYTIKGILTNNGTIEIDTNGQIGMVASGNNASITNIGTINLNGNNSSAVYIDDESMISLTSAPNIIFGGNQNFGIYVDKGIVNIGVALNMASPNTKENIYLYATDGSMINHTIGNIAINGGTPAGASKTIGIYLKNNGVQNIYTSTGGTISVQGGAIGIYSKDGNRMEINQVDAVGDKTVGLYIENGGVLKGKVTASGALLTESVVGVYESAGMLTIDTLLSLEVGAGNTSGLGMYLENGASVTGSLITIDNKNTIKTNVGIYYTGNHTLSHGTDITLLGNKVVGIYADNSMNLSNNKAITYTVGASEQVAAYVSGNATYNNTGSINITTNDSTGIYVAKGLGKNTGTISVGGANSAALMAQGKTGADTATVENVGTINVNSGAGIVIGDTSIGGGVLGISKGKNTGTINLVPGTTGVAISGNDNSTFDGSTGTINVNGTVGNTSTGFMMLGTISGQIVNAGNIVLGDSNSVAIYAKDSVIDFGVNISGTNEGTGIFADGTSIISGNINASNSNGVIALYINSNSIVLNGATIISGISKTLGSSGVGIYFDSNYTLSNTTVQTTGDGIGIVIGVGRTLNYITGARVNVGNGGTGIYLGGAGSILNADGGEINITNNGIGINIGAGGTANVGVSGPISINFTGTGGIAVVSAAGGTINLGNNITITGFGTMASTIDGSLVNNGNIIINNGALGLQGYFTTGGSLSNAAGASITVNAGGIGMAANGVGTVTVTNDGTITVSGDGAVGMASELGTISNLNGTMNITNNGLGIYATGSADISALGLMTVGGGIGFVADGIAITPSGTITLQNGTSDKYSIGGYFINVGSLPTTYTVTQNANYTIGNVIKGSGIAVNVSTINQIGGVYNHQIALNLIGEIGNNLVVSLGAAVNVSDYLGNAGENNIGVNGKYIDINMGVNGVTVGDSAASADMSKASVGVYLDNGSLVTTGNISAGKYSIGILGENITGISVGGIDAGDRGIGISAEGDGSSGATIAGNSIITGNDKSIGVYGKNINTTITGGMTVGQLSSLGVVNEGRGDITVDGNINVAGVTNIDNEEGAIAIYKNGSLGDIKVGHNTPTTMTIGREGYGIYAIRSIGVPGTMTIDNRADINLGTSAVGIYGSGDIAIDNSGNISIGDTYLGSNGDHNATEDHRNSVGIYLENGASLINRGNIDVLYDHSVGIYGNGTGVDIRLASGTMTVDNGGVGILAKGGAMVTIEAGASIIVKVTNPMVCMNTSTGVAVYAGSQVTNRGSMTVDDGIGILVSPGASFVNEGTLIINNGVGISGSGSFIQGPGSNITINGGILALAVGEGEDKIKGSVTITKDGVVEINNNYFAIGGTFDAGDRTIRLDGAYVGIDTLTNAKVPLFKAELVEGNINLLPDFAKSGNGYEWTIMDFARALGAALTEVGATSRVGVSTSPLFVKKEIVIAGKEALRIAKVPYGDLVVEEQFKELYDGLDNILYKGAKGADALKNFNAYLEGIYNKDKIKFDEELTLGLSETRGDIYSTMQKRMKNVQSAFDSSWEELERQYNTSKNNDKYSIIYKHGNYKDPTMGIDDYEYTTYGAIYMKEYDGKNYGNKYGYSVGFAVSKFKFDDDYKFDNKSKEDIYSLRVGMHNVKSITRSDGKDKLRLITRFELGYNRHESNRVIELDKVYRTKGKYNTFNITFDNKLEYNISRSHSHSLDIYGAVNMEYSKIGGFSEKSSDGLELQIKKNDNLSVEAEVGVQGHKRILIGKKVSAKLEGKIAYSHEFGNSSKANRARVAKGGGDYYSLIEPEKEKGAVKASVGITFEKANKAGITFEVEARKYNHKKDVDISYGVRFKYVF